MNSLHIRPYNSSDRQAVRALAVGTAFMGNSANIFFDDQEILADALTKYFTDYEPQSCFVAFSDDELIGYILGARNVTAERELFSQKIVFPLIVKALSRGIFLSRKNIRFFVALLMSFFKKEFRDPDFSQQYPATLHINLKEKFRREGIGSQLMDTYLAYLVQHKIGGVHFATMTEQGHSFFKKYGFEILYFCHRSYYRYLVHRSIVMSIFGKKLTLQA